MAIRYVLCAFEISNSLCGSDIQFHAFTSWVDANFAKICQFCFNSLKNTYEKSTCPNCRRPYDEKTIQYKIPTAEEFKADQANKTKKQAAARRRETEKKEVESSSRRNLAGVRVKQQNLVYVIGLVPQIKDESSLLQTLRGVDYFGQYGDIDKIVVSKAKPGAPSQGVGVYITYARREDAALCIATIDGSVKWRPSTESSVWYHEILLRISTWRDVHQQELQLPS